MSKQWRISLWWLVPNTEEFTNIFNLIRSITNKSIYSPHGRCSVWTQAAAGCRPGPIASCPSSWAVFSSWYPESVVSTAGCPADFVRTALWRTGQIGACSRSVDVCTTQFFFVTCKENGEILKYQKARIDFVNEINKRLLEVIPNDISSLEVSLLLTSLILCRHKMILLIFTLEGDFFFNLICC